MRCQNLPTGITPVEIFEAFDEGGSAVLLDSARTHPVTGRYSVIATRPTSIFQVSAAEAVAGADPISDLRRLHRERLTAVPDGWPPFIGGAIGFLSYNACRLFEDVPSTTIEDIPQPAIWFGIFDDVAVVDHLEECLWLFAGVHAQRTKSDAEHALKWMADRIKTVGPTSDALDMPTRNSNPGVCSTFSQTGFEAAVRRAKEYIASGDVYQVNLSQRLDLPLSVGGWDLYRRLRQVNPSPFAAYIRTDDLELVSSSPERLVRLDHGRVDTRPIAGTRPRGWTPMRDEALKTELLLNEKERAEHVMLVDLERNDLGRVCRMGSVQVDELMVLEQFSHVTHIVSSVVGDLENDRDSFDLIAAVFPGGTITGCPKIRCMEIIDELEPTSRGIYTGSVGYISDSGNMDLNIVIRTCLVRDGTGHIQVGAGIVADSDPTREWEETMHKAHGVLTAAGADPSWWEGGD
jgi:anthranilate/para-aminobenzoate synthase component I